MDEGHIGFIVTHFDTDILVSGEHRGECVFVAPPKDPAYLTHQLIDRMYEHKFAGEHLCFLTVSNDQRDYAIHGDGVKPLRMLILAGSGELIDAETDTIIGKAILA